MDSSDVGGYSTSSLSEKFPWTLQYEELATCMKFIVTVHKPSRQETSIKLRGKTETTCIPSDFNIFYVNITIVLQNSVGVVTHTTRISRRVSRPRGADNCLPWNVTEFYLNKYSSNNLPKGFVAFTISGRFG